MIKQKICIGAASLGLVLVATGAQALQFDGATVTSRLNEPLDARFTISHLASTQARSLEIRKARPRDYQLFGFDRQLVVGRIELNTETEGSGSEGGGPVVVHLSTNKPITTSMISFLVEADTGNGRYFHRYDLLINPPQGRTASSQTSYSSRNTGAGNHSDYGETHPGRSSAIIQRGQIDISQNEQYPGPGEQRKHENYGPVEAGQTLRSIAGVLKPEGATTAQMAVALYRATPRSFEGGIDGLEEGAFLTVPYDVNVLAVDPQAAEQIMQKAGSR